MLIRYYIYKGLEPRKKERSKVHLCVLSQGFLEIMLRQGPCSPHLLRTCSQRKGDERWDRRMGKSQGRAWPQVKQLHPTLVQLKQEGRPCVHLETPLPEAWRGRAAIEPGRLLIKWIWARHPQQSPSKARPWWTIFLFHKADSWLSNLCLCSSFHLECSSPPNSFLSLSWISGISTWESSLGSLICCWSCPSCHTVLLLFHYLFVCLPPPLECRLFKSMDFYSFVLLCFPSP